MKFSLSEIETARSFVDKITAVFADMDATENHLERASIADEIGALTLPGKDNPVVNLADEIIGAKIQAAVEQFLNLTRTFWADEGRARRTAEATDLVVSLSHQRTLLKASPSIDQARQIQGIFMEFLADNPTPETTENFVAHSKEETAAPSSDLHEKGATAEQQATTIKS